MITGTKEAKTFEDLKEILIQSKADMEKGLEENAMNFATIMTIKDLGFPKVTEELKVSLIGSIITGTIAEKMIEVLDEEIEALDGLIKFRKSNKPTKWERCKEEKEVSEEDIQRAVESIAEMLGLEK